MEIKTTRFHDIYTYNLTLHSLPVLDLARIVSNWRRWGERRRFEGEGGRKRGAEPPSRVMKRERRPCCSAFVFHEQINATSPSLDTVSPWIDISLVSNQIHPDPARWNRWRSTPFSPPRHPYSPTFVPRAKSHRPFPRENGPRKRDSNFPIFRLSPSPSPSLLFSHGLMKTRGLIRW